MTNKKAQEKIAKIMLKNSFTKGFLDEKKIKNNLAIIAKQKPQRAVKILKTYKTFVSQAQNKEIVKVETAKKLQNSQEREIITKTGAKKIQYIIKPEMVFGVKITHGDWVFENNLDSKIQTIAQTQ